VIEQNIRDNRQERRHDTVKPSATADGASGHCDKKMSKIALPALIRIDSNDVFFYTCRAF
jgi:hypothetical protein